MSLTADESWFISTVSDRLNPVWRDRILVILEEIAGLDSLAWSVVLDEEEGTPISRVIQQGGPSDSTGVEAYYTAYPALARSLRHAWRACGEPMPTHMIEDVGDELVFTGFVANFMIVAAFKRTVPRGAVVMRLAKRIRHLRGLEKSRERSALYV